MSLLVPARRFDPDVPEMMDLPARDPRILYDDLRNLRILNAMFGGYRAVRRHIIPMFNRVDSGRPIRVLDLATGSGDHPLQLLDLARSLERKIEVVAVDRNPQILRAAGELVDRYPNITLYEADIRSLSYADGSFDVVLCSLALHHFSSGDAIDIVSLMYRLSSVGFIVNDLNRTRVGAWVTRAFTAVAMRNPMTWNDSYVSFLRAFTAEELLSMARHAGVSRYRVHPHPLFRLVLVGEH
jgi:ubiquinone/menaquinone biosynthesis C-methylase UbiE